MKHLQRQWPFLKSVLKEANCQKREELLQHANAPVTPSVMQQLRPYKQVLRQLGARRHSMKKRRGWLMSQRSRVVAGIEPSLMSMCRFNLPVWVSLLQEANQQIDHWKEKCEDWKHKYHCLHQAYVDVLNSLLCEQCRSDEDIELCVDCQQRWKKCI